MMVIIVAPPRTPSRFAVSPRRRQRRRQRELLDSRFSILDSRFSILISRYREISPRCPRDNDRDGKYQRDTHTIAIDESERITRRSSPNVQTTLRGGQRRCPAIPELPDDRPASTGWHCVTRDLRQGVSFLARLTKGSAGTTKKSASRARQPWGGTRTLRSTVPSPSNPLPPSPFHLRVTDVASLSLLSSLRRA